MRTERYQSAGVDLAIDVFLPKGGDRRPGIVFFHGGGWSFGDRAQFHPQCERLAATGFVAATAQYRLGISIAACVEDAAAAVAWMRANADALALDATLLAAGGGSAGGHMALCLATCPAYAPVPPVLAAVAYNPLVDLDQAAGTNGLPPAGAEAGDLSPLRHAGLSTPPVLIQHGTADRVVPIDGSRRFRDATPGCELIEYEGAAHGFFNPPVSQERYEATTAATLAFLGRVAAIPAST